MNKLAQVVVEELNTDSLQEREIKKRPAISKKENGSRDQNET